MTGTELQALVTAAGIGVTFDSVPASVISAWWDSEALLYSDAQSFADGHGLTKGGTVTVAITHDGDVGYNIWYGGEQDFTFVQDNGTWRVQFYTEQSANDRGYTWNLFANVWHNDEAYISGYRVIGTVAGFYFSADAWEPPVGRWMFYPDPGNTNYWIFEMDTTFRYFFRDEWRQHHTENSNRWFFPEIKKETVNGTVKLSWGSGGGGGGGKPTTTLIFTATAGLSGRHCDPIENTGWLYRPASRTEGPAYGSGGYGGHGGGGGAGASTAVIYRFSTNKANNLEQIAVARRHGYGSGGGQGGKGGDGCILIFW